MTSFKQWNYGDVHRGNIPSTKKGVSSYEKASRSSFDYTLEHHAQARLLCNNLLTKTIDFSGNWLLWWSIYIIGFVSSALVLEEKMKKQRLHGGISCLLS